MNVFSYYYFDIFEVHFYCILVIISNGDEMYTKWSIVVEPFMK